MPCVRSTAPARRVPRRCGPVLRLWLAVCLTFSAARAAADSGWTLDWEAPPSCPGADIVRARVDAARGGMPGPAVSLRVVGRLQEQPEATGYALRLWLWRGAEPPGGRRLRDSDCGALADAAALVIALALDGAPLPQTDAETPPAPPALQSPPAGAAWPWAPSLEARLLLESGALPGTTAGLQLGGALDWGPLSAAAHIGGWLPATARSEAVAGAARAHALLAGAALCATWPAGPVRLSPCIAGEIGLYSAYGVDLGDNRVARSIYRAAGPGLRARLLLDRQWSLLFSGAWLWLGPRPELVVGTPVGDTRVHTAAPFSARFGVGVRFSP